MVLWISDPLHLNRAMIIYLKLRKNMLWGFTLISHLLSYLPFDKAQDSDLYIFVILITTCEKFKCRTKTSFLHLNFDKWFHNDWINFTETKLSKLELPQNQHRERIRNYPCHVRSYYRNSKEIAATKNCFNSLICFFYSTQISYLNVLLRHITWWRIISPFLSLAIHLPRNIMPSAMQTKR